MNEQELLIEELRISLGEFKRRMMRSRDELLGKLQLTRSQIEVLAVLGESKDQTIGDIAGYLSVTHSAGTQTVETLVKRGLVVRTPDAGDRRIVRVNLSLEGVELSEQLNTSRRERMHGLFSGLSVPELKLMIKTLQQMSEQFDSSSEQNER